MAFLLFGNDESDFRSLTYSFLNLMRFSISEMPYDELVHSNRIFGSMFFFFWSILMILILVNVFIAILSEAYTQVADELAEEKIKLNISFNKNSVFKRASSVYNSLEKFVHNNVFKSLDTNKDDHVDADELAAIKNIDKEQATSIIERLDTDGNMKLDKNEFQNLDDQVLTEIISGQ